MVYGSMPHGGMTLKKNDGHKCTNDMLEISALLRWRVMLKYQTGKSPKQANRLSSDFLHFFFLASARLTR